MTDSSPYSIDQFKVAPGRLMAACPDQLPCSSMQLLDCPFWAYLRGVEVSERRAKPPLGRCITTASTASPPAYNGSSHQSEPNLDTRHSVACRKNAKNAVLPLKKPLQDTDTSSVGWSNRAFFNRLSGWKNSFISHSISVFKLCVFSAAIMLVVLHVSTFGYAQNSSLHTAAKHNRVDMIQTFLDAGANIEAKLDNGSTPLHVAAVNNSADAARALIGAGAIIEARDNLGKSPLHWAAAFSSVEVIQILIDAGANIEAKDTAGGTPLYAAAFLHATDGLRALISAGANIEARSIGGLTAMHMMMIVVFDSDSVGALPVMIGAGANVNARSSTGSTPLHFLTAGTYVDKSRLRMLLYAGADVNAKNNEGNTPLHFAVQAYDVEAITILLEAGADIRAKNHLGRTPFQSPLE